jgi:hypothetical protein
MSQNDLPKIRMNSLCNIKKHLTEYHKLLLDIEKDKAIQKKLKTNDGFELLEITHLIELITQIEEKNNANNVVF